MLNNFGYTQQQKDQFRNFSPQQKWLLLSQSKQVDNAHRKSPNDYLICLKKPDIRLEVCHSS